MAYVSYLPSTKMITVVFRGTVDITNWIEDFTYYQVDYAKCK